MSSPGKYRGIRVDNGEMVKGCLCRFFEDDCYILPSTKAVCSYDDVYKIYEIGGWLKAIPETVGQYTGLKKCNVDVCEDDVLAAGDGNNYLVRWDNGSARFWGANTKGLSGVIDLDHLLYSTRFDAKVIGNIHQNPELLETG